MKSKIDDFCNTCPRCQVAKNYTRGHGELKGILANFEPFAFVYMDIFGPVPLEKFGESGKAFIISFVDFCTRTVRLQLLNRTKGTNVIAAFKNCWLSQYPTPKILYSDQGPQYTSIALKEYCKNKGIRKTHSSVYNPTSNAISERLNQTLALCLRLYQGTNIFKAIRKAEIALNFGYHRRIGSSPNELLSNSSVFDLLKRNPSLTATDAYNKTVIEATSELDKRNAKRAVITSFRVNDLVYLRNLNKEKLDNFWLGPFKIIACKLNKTFIK